MTQTEFEFRELNGRMCRFQLQNGTEIIGVISDFFDVIGDDKYYFVPKPQMDHFQSFNRKDDWDEMRKICKDPIDLSEIVSGDYASRNQ